MFLLVSAATVAMVVWDFSKNAQVARSAADRLSPNPPKEGVGLAS